MNRPGMRPYDFLKENVRACMEAGFLPKTDFDIAAFAIWSFTQGMASLIIRQRCGMIPQKTISAVVDGAIEFMTSQTAAKKGR